MICKHCGTEIADKALVCYRCGRATAEPRVQPGRPPAARSPIPMVAALAVLILSALFMARAASGELPRAVSYVVAGLAVVVLVWWIARRRRRRDRR
jgi:Flp pilus assembly protein TadB